MLYMYLFIYFTTVAALYLKILSHFTRAGGERSCTVAHNTAHPIRVKRKQLQTMSENSHNTHTHCHIFRSKLQVNAANKIQKALSSTIFYQFFLAHSHFLLKRRIRVTYDLRPLLSTSDTTGKTSESLSRKASISI